MISLEWPYVLLTLPLPVLVRHLLPETYTKRMAALRTPLLAEFELAGGGRLPETGRWTMRLAMLAWVMLVLAAARPQWTGDPVHSPVTGRDLMLAVDLSGSMATQDFHLEGRLVDRLTALKAVAGGFIQRRTGDRLGLILFGRNAYLQAPLTFDRTTVETLLRESAIGLAGRETALGDAIGLAVKRLRDPPASSRVLILLTDGANTAGAVDPVTAASLAAQAGLRIYTIGITADDTSVPFLMRRRQMNPSHDLDEATLRAIAARTGGQYFRAGNTARLEHIYALLDELEPVSQNAPPFRPAVSLYPWPLSFALVLCLALAGTRAGWRRNV